MLLRTWVMSIVCCSLHLAMVLAETADDQAARVLKTAGIKPGLIVHLHCGHGELTAALGAEEEWLVHGLDVHSENVATARARICSLDSYGRVSIDRFDGRHLPYVDNLVNLIVADDLGNVSENEVQRVLSPGGVACVKKNGRWTRSVKPWPTEIDQWTHWLHDASGNAVSTDTVVGPPRHYQWTASPAWSSHHDTVLTTSAMVTAGGRLFAIVNEAPISEFDERSEGHWFLTARDAFNGVLLWKHLIRHWGWQEWGESFTKRFAQPVQLPSRLVAEKDRVYVTLGADAPVSLLDARSGDVLQTYQNTNSADEILLHDGKLLVTVYDSNIDRTLKRIRLIDPDDGAVIWQSGPHKGLAARYDAVDGWDPLDLTAYRDRVVFVSKEYVTCLDFSSGAERWRIPRPAHPEHRMNLGVRESENCSLVNDGDVVLYTQPVGKLPHTNHTVPCDLYAFSADTGKLLWENQCGVWAWGHQADVFVIRNLVWIHEHIPTEMQGPHPVHLESIEHALLGLDLHTGEVKRRIPTTDIFRIGHHHRCYRNKATTKYLFTARRGTELTDLDSGQIRVQPWLRSECRFGIVPANGLLYTAPHPCGCYAGVLLTGYNALASRRSRVESRELRVQGPEFGDGEDRLKRGPAYESAPLPSSAFRLQPSADWLTYRQNDERSGFIAAQIATDVETCWRAELEGPLSAPTVANGRVFVAEKDRHAIVALDTANGHELWRFMAGGPIDSPPTLADGHAVFGTADGCVYCLTAADGQLVWRFRAAPNDLRMIADDRIESVWPVHGSVLVQDHQVITIAGRSSYLDGGLYAYRLNLETGQVFEEKRISHEELTQRKTLAARASRYDEYYTDGVLSDILVTHNDSVFLKAMPVFGEGAQSGPLLTAQSGFLDASLFERSFWYVMRPGQAPIGAQLIVHNADSAYGFRAYPSAQRGGPWHALGSGYTLFAAPCSTTKQPSDRRSTRRQQVPGFTEKLVRVFTWQRKIPVRAQSMVLTENALLLAGSPDIVRPATDPYAAIQGKLGGQLLVISPADGTTLEDYDLPAPPVWDGMAVAAEHLYITLQDGTLVCLGPSK